ncbi:MAG: TatD family hydrolase [candidate division Zixibacteria bacterium]|nr:TatD family hydrolase [candidate division Zixibacteria bacterium]
MFDSHCHLDGREYRGRLDEVINDAVSSGVHTMVNIGADLPSSIASVEMAQKYASIHATVGVHPHDATTYNAVLEGELLKLLQKPKVVAIGEIGLDYYRDLSPRPVQREVFRKQLEIAVAHKLPVVIHTRDSYSDTLNIIREYATRLSGGVFHCFPGSQFDALEVIDLGFHISVGGIITYPGSRMAEVAKVVPLKYILMETDCPYLTPVPFRGKPNRPSYLRYVRDKLAELRDIDVTEAEEVTDLNSRRVYRLTETFEG